MKRLRNYLFPWKVALLLAGISGIPCFGQVNKTEAKNSPRQVALNLPSAGPEIAKSALAPVTAIIERVQASHVGQDVEVRVTGSAALSCTPFRLADPDRLVLDCSGAHTQVRSVPSRVDVYPVRSIRVGQFRAHVVRVVLDLAAQSPYSLRPDGNSVVVTFNSNAPKPVATEIASKEVEHAFEPSEGPHDLAAKPPAPAEPASLPLVKHEDPVPASVNDAPHADQVAQNSLLPTPIEAGPSPQPSAAGSADSSATEPNSPIENFDSSSSDQDYVIGVQDVLAINVWRDPELSRTVPVRPDGKISLPLIGDLHVSGLTPRMLQDRLTKDLDAYIRKPQVTVIVQEVNSRKFYIMGQVEHPGTFSLTSHITVLDALAMAGGFRDFAKISQIYLLRVRPDGTRKRIPFDYKDAVNGKVLYRDIEIQTDDTLVVP